MAQGGHSWPSGHYDPNIVNHADDVAAYDTSNFDFQHFAPTQSNNAYGGYLPGLSISAFGQDNSHGYPTGNFAENDHSNAEMGQERSVGFMPNSFSGHEHPISEYTTTGHSQEYPNVPGSIGESWHNQASHHQTNFGQPQMPYDHQSAQQQYHQQQFQAPSHVPIATPPPGQRTGAHFGVENGSKPSFQQVHLNSQPSQIGEPQYAFQGHQGQFMAAQFAQSQPQSPVGLQNQNPTRGQSFRMPGPVTTPTGSPYPGPQPPAPQVKRTKPTTSVATARTDSPAAMSNALSSAPPPVAPHHANSQPPITHAGAVQPSLAHYASQPSGNSGDATATAWGSTDINDGMKQVNGCKNLFFSDIPLNDNIPEVRRTAEKPWLAGWNASTKPLLPKLGRPLPAEIVRDYVGRTQLLQDPNLGAKDRQTTMEEVKKLEQQFVVVTGKAVQELAKEANSKKLSTVRKTKASNNSDSDSDDPTKETDRKARQIKMAERPSDPVRAVEQEIVKILWHDPDEAHNSKKTAIAIDAFGNQVDKLWREVKRVREEAKVAKDKTALQQEFQVKANCMHAAIQTALDYGDAWTVRYLGDNTKMLTQLINALKYSYKLGDFDGVLPKSILHLMSQFTTVRSSLLNDTFKLKKTREKYEDDIDKECRDYFDRIFSNAEEADRKARDEAAKKAKESGGADEPKGVSSISKRPPSIMARDLQSASKMKNKAQPTGSSSSEIRHTSNDDSNTASPLKRARENDVDSRVSKKPMVESSAKRPRDEDGESRATKKMALDSSSTQSTAKTTSAMPSSTTATIAQPRVRPPGSILPGRARPTPKPTPKKPEAQQSSISSTISGLLAEIAKPTPVAKAREEPARAPETPEEKAKRLRKEARRGRTVTWKPDHELTEVRIFQHDSAEDEGRASNMIRDARDNRSEGQMLKRGIQNEEEEDGDADGQGDATKEVSIHPWVEPSAIDMSVIDRQQRDKSFVTRGGARTFHTDQQTFMGEYERTELMAVYTSGSDIPETPKSPTRKTTDSKSASPKIGYLPSDQPKLQEFHRRALESRQFGRDASLQLVTQRLRTPDTTAPSELDKVLGLLRNASGVNQAQPSASSYSLSANMSHSNSPSASYPSQSPQSCEARDAEVYRLLTLDVVKNWKDPNPYDPAHPKTTRRSDYADPKVQADADAFENICEAFKGKHFPANEPPEYMRENPTQVKEWQDGYDKDMAANASKEATQRAQKLHEQNPNRSATIGQLPVALSTTQSLQDPNAAATAAAAAWYAQFAQAQSQAQAPAPSSASISAPAQAQQSDYSQYALILQQVQALQAAQANQGTQAYQGYQGYPGYQGYLAQPSQTTQAPAAPQDSNPQLQAVLAALSGQSTQQQAPAIQPSLQDNDPTNAYWRSWQQSTQNYGQSQFQPPSSQSQQHRDRDRERGNRSSTFGSGADASLDYGPSEYESRDKGSRGRKDKEKSNFHGRGGKEHNKGINRALIGTKACSFWAEGKCAKGDQCTFRHDPDDLKKAKR
ncbi:uncharacterized protein BCR38DRAFT_142302 [Pseudomassariella vexata]|uniref:C3H1-type domain-containing protein n=1 Tax=Pseudomassariella vexata TaxID=1141098 RepID=A0A1Y2EDX1_9PEZI|nr:uncharacterized protein BCR38DRAFT_142302 [Pseudomassariella vexata]ORY68985.1 hypothetical protein BCR38DRAFT_142302 [Pseudomassariella vexata]